VLWHAVTCGDAHAVRALLAAPGGLESLQLDGESCLRDASARGNWTSRASCRKRYFGV
jgi:hypothetical protein